MALSHHFVEPASTPPWNLDDPVLRPLFRWDTAWYLTIARDGYAYDGDPTRQQNVAFFPLYPLTCRACHIATGLSIPLCGVLLSNLAFLVGLSALWALARREMDAPAARLTLLLLAFFPASLFFSTMYSESFYLAFSVLAYSAFRRQQFVRGGLWAGLATATRLTGIVLLVALVLEALPRVKDRQVRKDVALGTVLTASGAAAFSLFLWTRFGDALAYLRVQQVRGWRGGFGLPFARIERGVRRTLRPAFTVDPFDAWVSLLFIGLACLLPAPLPRSYAVYMLLTLAIPLATRAATMSVTRFMNPVFPGFMALGIVGTRTPWLGWLTLGVFAASLIVFSMHFAQWDWVG
jgi:hypothetical protein